MNMIRVIWALAQMTNLLEGSSRVEFKNNWRHIFFAVRTQNAAMKILQKDEK